MKWSGSDLSNMTYIVIFETDNPTVDANVSTAIKGFGEWAALTPQSYLLDTTRAVRAIMETLQPMLGPMDSLWVFTPSSPWSGYGDPTVDDHAHGYLGKAEDYVPKDWDEVVGHRR
jgi:hypothetical protein